MKKWLERQDAEAKLLIAGLAVYGLVYLTVSAVELVFGVVI